MNTFMEIEVFRAGEYGPKGLYTAADLHRLADDYDPARHEAPVTLDHRQDGPAYGWVEGLRCAGDVLVARLKDLHESLREWIRQGAYKKRSIELYRSFTRTGRPYLRAVSFLGACPPEVKGLADPVFREDEGERVVVEFEECAAGGDANAPGASVESRSPAESAPNPPADPRFAEMESLRAEAAGLAADLEQERAGRKRLAIERFCEEARRDARLLPAWEKNGLVEFLLALDDRDARFEAGGERRLTALEWFQGFLLTLPPQVQLGELAPSESATGPARLAVPLPTDRAAIRPQSLALHERAVAHCRQHPGVAYVEALQAVARL